MKNALYEEIDRLKKVNGELLEACKKMLVADTPETIDEAYILMASVVKKAVTP